MTDRELAQQADQAFRKTTITYPDWQRRVAQGKYPALGPPSQWGIGFQNLDQIDIAPPPTSLGTNLPSRLVTPSGPQTEYTTYDALKDAILAKPTPGSRLKLTAPIDCGGRDLLIRCNGTAAANLLIDLAAPVRNGRVLISQASYTKVILRDSDGSPGDALKLTDGSHHIDVDGLGGYLRGCKGEAFLQTDPTCHDWQIWNFRCRANGSSLNYDQDAYVAAARGSWPTNTGYACVIGNFDMEPWAYGYQAYPDSRGLIATGLLISGTRSVSDPRGGAVFGTNGVAGKQTSDCLLVASVIKGARNWGVHNWGDTRADVATRISVRSCFGWDNQPGDWAQDPGIEYLRCAHSDGGLVDPLDYGWVSPLDIDGKPRTAGAVKAGCYA